MGLNVWAFDDGYGDNKLFGGDYTKLIPSQCTPWITPLRSEGLKEGSTIDPLSHIGIEIDGVSGKYLVGEGAINQSSNLNWNGGNNKHKDQNFPIIAKTCLGILAGKSPEVTVQPLVMGLPVEEDENSHRHSLLQEILVGEHQIKLSLADGKEYNKIITVNKLITKKQPFGTFCDLILNNKGEIIDKPLARGFNVIVDIGTRTLNIYTLDKLEPVASLSRTYNQGVHTAYDYVNNFIREHIKAEVPSGKIADVVRRGEIKGIDITPIRDRSYRHLANEIIGLVETLFVDNWAYIENIIVTGGGAELMSETLKSVFPARTIVMNRYSTVRGFWKYGVRDLLSEQPKVSISMPGGGIIKLGASS